MTPDKARAVRRLARLGQPPEPAAWLALRSLRALQPARNETMGIELSLAAAIWWRRLHALGAGCRRPGRGGLVEARTRAARSCTSFPTPAAARRPTSTCSKG